jgi:hypothetical protein
MKSLLMLLSVLFMGLAATCSAQDEEAKPFDLTNLYGETYHGCRILKVTPAAIVVAYDKGVAKIQFTLLSKEWKDLYNYDPAEALAYERSEQKARLAAEEKRKELKKKRDKHDIELMKNLAELEKKQNAEVDERERKLAEETKQAAAPPLAALPGDASNQQPIATTEVVVPTVNSLGQPYTPAYRKNQPYVYPDGGLYIYPGGSTYVFPQSGYQPLYVNPYSQGYNPYCINPYGYVPGHRNVPGTAGQITVGPGIIRIHR